MHAGFGQFAAFDRDVIDNKAAVGRGRLQMPVLAIGGDHSLGSTMAYIMRFAADNVSGVVITQSGHWLMEEQPKATVSAIVDFLSVDSSINSRTLGVAEIGALARSGAGVGTSESVEFRRLCCPAILPKLALMLSSLRYRPILTSRRTPTAIIALQLLSRVNGTLATAARPTTLRRACLRRARSIRNPLTRPTSPLQVTSPRQFS
jgi:hypothetical protein